MSFPQENLLVMRLKFDFSAVDSNFYVFPSLKNLSDLTRRVEMLEKTVKNQEDLIRMLYRRK